ncbi:helix-turn-helix transcriptional regulator [Actinokineospora spheciospongiae]|uniref:helix-turn-helix transcriptional regulator n=1 Tax=Actinokineospora spheciospongiae TaxID=909613 RepID=UPI0005502001|nr:helix-turn-helix transcriptional regulator [Actinokineospora spheciospongiae]PWW51488.1 DNA-binding XRE family transcriptional regulator [Actinokineospora spheciospongiae]
MGRGSGGSDSGLRAARRALGFFQDEFGYRLGVSSKTVGRWEKGVHEPQPWMRGKIAKVLGLTIPELSALLPSPEPVNPPPVAPASCARSFPCRDGMARCDEQPEPIRTLAWELMGTMNRRDLLRLLGWMTATAGVPAIQLDPDEQERVVKAIAAPGRVDEQVIGHIQTVYQTCRRQDDTLGAQAVLPTVLAQLSLAQGLIGSCPPQLRQALLSTCGGLAGLAGWLLVESTDYGKAWEHFERSRALAHEARDPALSSLTLARMSNTAKNQDRLHQAVDFGEAARKAAERADDPLLQAYAASETARAYAKDGQEALCMATLEEVEGKLSTADPEMSSKSPAYFFDHSYLPSTRSACFLNLDRPADAARQARDSLTHRDGALVRDNAYTMLYLADAQIKLRQIDDAATITGTVAEATAQNGSVRLLERLRTTRATLGPWADTAAVRELDQRLLP